MLLSTLKVLQSLTLKNDDTRQLKLLLPTPVEAPWEMGRSIGKPLGLRGVRGRGSQETQRLGHCEDEVRDRSSLVLGKRDWTLESRP